MDYTFHHVGDYALCVEFANEISLSTNQKVCALKLALEKRAIYGIQEFIPTYRSLLILYDPFLIAWQVIKTTVDECIGNLGNLQAEKTSLRKSLSSMRVNMPWILRTLPN